jgi:cytochrome P450
VIAEMLGVPAERFEDFKRWSDSIVRAISGVASREDPEEAVETREEFLEYIAEVVAERRQSPRDDLISTLVQAGEGEGTLTEGEAIAFTMLLLVAGNETTTNLIGNAVLALLAHPQELARVRANPGLVPALVEETLRYDSPVQGLFRQTTEDVELAGTSLPKGALLMLLFASANRDERQFPDPERFDVTRNPRGHLAFGFGIHFCLGAALARLEARIALESLLARCDEISRPEEAVEWIDSLLLRGPRSLPLRFRAA